MNFLINEIHIIAMHLNIVEYFQFCFAFRLVSTYPVLSYANYKDCLDYHRYYKVCLSSEHYTDISFNYVVCKLIYPQARRMIPFVSVGSLTSILKSYDQVNIWDINISTWLLYRLKHYLDRADLKYYINSLILESCSNGTDEQVLALLQVNEVEETVLHVGLHEACRSGNVNVVRLLLNRGVDINYCCNDCTGLLLAVMSDHLEVVEELLQDPRIIITKFELKYLQTRSLLLENCRSMILFNSKSDSLSKHDGE
ncbi:hypothetical protein HDV06_005249 [Boothiomyces sp. JEL0866]|nr:hypothetical protein HDV06_005249 [Boothiomyces sp. JEL0866]